MNYHVNEGNVKNAIESACPSLKGTFSVTRNKTVCLHNVDCVHFDLKFDYLLSNLPQFTINSDTDDGEPMEGIGLTYENIDLKLRGPGIWYAAIPFEMIRTAHTVP